MKKRKKRVIRSVEKSSIKNVREISNKSLSSKPKKPITPKVNKSSQKLFFVIIISLAFVALVLALSFLYAERLVNPPNLLNFSNNISLVVLSPDKEALYVKFNLEDSKISNLAAVNFSIYTKNGSFYSYYTSYEDDNYTIVNKNNFFENWLKKEETKVIYDYAILSDNLSKIQNFEDIINVSVKFIFLDDPIHKIDSNSATIPPFKPPIVSPPQTPQKATPQEESPCVPNCSGKQCGSNGCGGSCGSCGINQKCSQNKCVVDCVEGNWTNTSIYRCNSVNNNIVREVKQTKDICPTGATEQWIRYDCNAGKVCYSGLGYPNDLCINSNLTCFDSDLGINYTIAGSVNNQFNDLCMDNQDLDEYYCFYNQIINDFEVKDVNVTCNDNGGCYNGVCFECIDLDFDGYNATDSNLYGGLCGNVIDCNDNDITINPNATETCGNGIDENCDGSDEVCIGEAALSSSSLFSRFIEWFKKTF